MAGEAEVSFVGNVGKDPELRFTPAGQAVCNLSVAVNSRKKVDGAWVDGEASWYRVSLWEDAGQALAEVVSKGDRVVVMGRLSIASFEKDGEKKTVPDVQASVVGIVPKQLPKNTQKKTDDGSPW